MKLKANRNTPIKFKLDQSSNLNNLKDLINLPKNFTLNVKVVLKEEKGHSQISTDNLKGWIFNDHWDEVFSDNNWLINSLKEFEGFRSRPYYDIAGILTIGYGRTKNIKDGEVTTKQKEEKWALDELNNIKTDIKKLVNVFLNDNQLDALAHFVYNIGINGFAKSTLLKKLNNGDYLGAANEFPRWNKAQVNGKKVPVTGLTKRRKHEKEHFLG